MLLLGAQVGPSLVPRGRGSVCSWPLLPSSKGHGGSISRSSRTSSRAAAAAADPTVGTTRLPTEVATQFVSLFRNAAPYIAGHRGKTFVVVIPGSVAEDEGLLRSTMSDIAQLHGLGIRLVLVIGVTPMIDELLRQRNLRPAYVGGYRVTSKEALRAAVEAAGQVRIQCEQFLSKGPAIPMIRRHTKGANEELHFEPALRVVSGNYVAAKRRGIVDGVDFGFTGEVRFVLKDDIRRQLASGNVVLLSNLGFTAGGDVLNCNTFEVGLRAALELGADKLFNMHMDEVTKLRLPPWLPLSDAQEMLIKTLQDELSSDDLDTVRASMVMEPGELADTSGDTTTTGLIGSESDGGSLDELAGSLNGSLQGSNGEDASSSRSSSSSGVSSSSGSSSSASSASSSSSQGERELQQARAAVTMFSTSSGTYISGPEHASKIKSSLANNRHNQILMDLDVWNMSGYPSAVSSSVIACCKGVKRAHLLDARLDGGLLLELYSRDGVGTMISADFYEGIRKAGPGDLDAIISLLRPLVEAGILVSRSREDMANLLQDFTVIERETKIMGCALLLSLGKSDDGVNVAELGAFCVDPVFRGSGRGDSLLDYVEQEARLSGVERLVLLTTRTADWFEQRDFRLQGPAFSSPLLPALRRARINPTRNSQLYAKTIEAPDHTIKQPGKRIGF